MSTAFSGLVTTRSWDWLGELCRPLGIQAQLLDASGTPLLSPEGPAAGGSLRELVANPARSVGAAVRAVFQSRSQQSLSVDGTDIVCLPLALEGRVQGALVIARAPHAGTEPVSGQQLGTIGGWLAGAVEGHLASAPASPDNLSALHKVLQHVVQGGTDRDLVAVFAEALALWHDVEVVGYIETAPGVFMRAVSLAGRTIEDRPIVFPPQNLPAELKITRMPLADIDGMEPTGSGEVLVTTLSRPAGQGTWLLTMSGAIDGCDAQVIGNYVSALDMAVALATAASRTRIAVLLSHRLSADAVSGFEAALEALRVALAAGTAKFVVESTGHQVEHQAGSGEGSSALEPDQARMTVRRLLRHGEAAALTLVRADQRHFTPLEHSMALVAAELLGDWAVRPGRPEGTEAAGVFGRTMEKLAAEALDRGLAVTAVVVSTNGGASGASEAFVDELRRQMRQSDVVGVLRPGELGLLLPDTTAAHAAAVARRLQGALSAITTSRSSIKAIGFATRVPGEGVAAGILNDARARALSAGSGLAPSTAG